MPPLVWSLAWVFAVLFSMHAACLAADADMPLSAGAAPAETLTTPGGCRGETGSVHQYTSNHAQENDMNFAH